MGRVICVGVALLAFAAAASVGIQGPKVQNNTAAAVGHYTAVGSVVFQPICLA